MQTKIPLAAEEEAAIKNLEETKLRIEGTEKQLASLIDKINEKQSNLVNKYSEQEAAILAEEPTGKIATNVNRLREEIAGDQRASETLAKILSSLQEDKKAGMRNIARIQTEQKRTEIMHLLSEIYDSISGNIHKIDELKTKVFEYREAMKAANLEPKLLNTRNYDDLIRFLKREISELLSGFPIEICSDKEPYTPKERRQSVGARNLIKR